MVRFGALLAGFIAGAASFALGCYLVLLLGASLGVIAPHGAKGNFAFVVLLAAFANLILPIWVGVKVYRHVERKRDENAEDAG